jgi:NTP pyrophosphatase (non-canonical NTP hydrolase)
MTEVAISGQTDNKTTLAELKDLMQRFVDARDWHTFHAPKNLAMSLAIEAAELMEHFQWMSVEASRTAANDAAAREAIGDELADVLCYALAMANVLDIDLSAAVRQKMRKNEIKYPAPKK